MSDQVNEHTPGPWGVDGPFTYDTIDQSKMYQFNVTGVIEGKAGRTIAEIGKWRDRPNAEADARLIASAPTMRDDLDALLAAAKWADNGLEHHPTCDQAGIISGPSCSCARGALRAAIAQHGDEA